MADLGGTCGAVFRQSLRLCFLHLPTVPVPPLLSSFPRSLIFNFPTPHHPVHSTGQRASDLALIRYVAYHAREESADADGLRQLDLNCSMAKWHTLPFEVKSLILSAHIDYVVQDQLYICFTIPSELVVLHSRYSRSAIPRPSSAESPPQSWSPPQTDLLTLLLVAPELTSEAISLVERKLRVVSLVDRSLCEHLMRAGPQREWCILSMMKLYYSRPTVVQRIPPNRLHHDCWICKAVDVDIVNGKIMDTQAKQKQLGQEK